MITVSKDGRGDYTRIQDAVDAVAAPERILIRKGIWREKIVIDRDGLTLAGEDRDGTVIVWNGCAKDPYPDGTEKGTFLSATVIITGRDVTLENLTVENDAGDGRTAGQAVAVYAAGDRGAFRNCSLKAHQDTLFCGPVRLPNTAEDIGGRTGSAEKYFRVEDGPETHSRLYFEDCLIRGTWISSSGPTAAGLRTANCL